MNILHLQTELNITCGVTKTIYQLCRNLNDDFQQHIITLGGDAINNFYDNNIQVTVINLKRNSVIGSFRIFFKIIKLCKRNNINIIHSHHRYFDFISYFISSFISVKTVCTVQSKVTGKKRISYKSKYLIAVSNTIKYHLINYFGVEENRITLINNFVDPEEIKLSPETDKIRTQLKIKSDSFVIGFIGRYSFKEKGIDILLNAFQDISKQRHDLVLLLVGKGEDEKLISKFIIENKLRACLIPAKTNIHDYFKICDLIVLPSKIDPFPLVMLEAGYMRKPFIGSNVDGISEFIENEVDGLLFETGNVESLMDKIKILISDNIKSNYLANNLYNKVISFYTADKIIPLYKNLYLHML